MSQSHSHMSQWKIVEGFERINIIQYIIHMLTLKQTYGYQDRLMII